MDTASIRRYFRFADHDDFVGVMQTDVAVGGFKANSVDDNLGKAEVQFDAVACVGFVKTRFQEVGVGKANTLLVHKDDGQHGTAAGGFVMFFFLFVVFCVHRSISIEGDSRIGGGIGGGISAFEIVGLEGVAGSLGRWFADDFDTGCFSRVGGATACLGLSDVPKRPYQLRETWTALPSIVGRVLPNCLAASH